MPHQIISNKKWHENRTKWLRQLAEQVQTRGDKIEISQDGYNVTIKIICEHKNLDE